MVLDVVSLTDMYDREAESVEQDQTANMCSLIFALHTAK